MDKLPVFATIATAYRFIFREFWTILRVSWFPLLVVAVVQYIIMRNIIMRAGFELEAVVTGKVSFPTLTAIQFVGLACVWAIGWSVVAVAVHRIILFHQRKGPAFALVTFGRAEFLFLTLPIVVLPSALIIVWALGTIGTMILVVVATLGQLQSAAFKALFFAALLLLFLSPIYVLIRLLLIYPIIVVESRLEFRQSWELTRDKFWRVFWVVVLGWLPVSIVEVLIQNIADWALNRSLAGVTSVDRAVEIVDRFLAYQTAANYLVSIVGISLGVALLCFSYKALKGWAPDEIVDRSGGRAWLLDRRATELE